MPRKPRKGTASTLRQAVKVRGSVAEPLLVHIRVDGGVSVGVAVVAEVLAAKLAQEHRHARQQSVLQEATAGARNHEITDVHA
jgi:hypothetical protein